MKLMIEIEIGNAAFADNESELPRILRDAASRLPWPPCDTTAPINLYDCNGNHVGQAEIAEV